MRLLNTYHKFKLNNELINYLEGNNLVYSPYPEINIGDKYIYIFNVLTDGNRAVWITYGKYVESNLRYWYFNHFSLDFLKDWRIL